MNAVITSPPYMNELDYVRDNRLRLWLLNRQLPQHSDAPRTNRENTFRTLIDTTFTRLADRVADKGVIVLVVGETSRGRQVVDSSSIIRSVFEDSKALTAFRLEATILDSIPDVRRSRRDLRGTKKETVLIYRRRVAAKRLGRSPANCHLDSTRHQ